jgi:Rho family protein
MLTGLSSVYQVDSQDSLENVESKWVAEIAENCPGVKLVLVALKCDLREKHSDEDDDATVGEAHGGGADGSASRPEKEMIDYQQGLEVARRIHALRYLGT